MSYKEPPNEAGLLETVRASLIMLSFGLAVLTFLVAIERPQWFHIQPGTGTAIALAEGADARTDGDLGGRREERKGAYTN
jgi:hypothetical protein